MLKIGRTRTGYHVEWEINLILNKWQRYHISLKEFITTALVIKLAVNFEKEICYAKCMWMHAQLILSRVLLQLRMQ